MKVYVVIEDNEFKCDIIGVYTDRMKATEKKLECLYNRSVIECEVE